MDELQLIIRSKDGGPLGETVALRAELDALFPGTVWEWTPSGLVLLSTADSAGVTLPLILRRAMERQQPKLCGEVRSSGLTATFNLGPDGPVSAVWVTLGGDKAAVAVGLDRLRRPPNWAVGPGEGWLLAGTVPEL